MYDVVVIGAGSGGITAAVTAVGFGKKVLLVDKSKPGGECTWSGCVPSKALINQAEAAWQTRKLSPGYVPSLKSALEHVRRVRETVYEHETPEVLSKMGIEFLSGNASFGDKKTLVVEGREIRAKKFVISTGSSPFIPPIEGLDSVPYLTNESIFELDDFPSSMIVLGGGAIGVELAQAMNRLGVKVSLVEMMDSILFREEQDLVLPLQAALEEEGVELLLGAEAIAANKSGNGILLRCERAGEQRTLEAEGLLVAIGRIPNTAGLGLENAGIRHGKKGIEVNGKMQTSVPWIYAIGDVVGPYQFSHMANVQGIQAVQNALLPFKRSVNYEQVAWVTFSRPELARAGMTEDEARQKYGKRARVYEFDFNDLDRARIKGPGIERLKLVLKPSGKIAGISILADRAGELIAEAQVIKSAGLNFGKIGGIIHPYPTYAEVFQKLGKKVLIDNILNHPLVKLFKGK